MQDVDKELTDTIKNVNRGILIQPKDVLSIIVSSKDPELAMAYNLPISTYQTGSKNVASYSQRLLGYLVDMEGYIDFPALGKQKVKGLTREEVSNLIKDKLVGDGIIRDAIVTTEFMNFKISVMGEVRSPGTFSLETDQITILEALSRAGDLTIYGRRDNILVCRKLEDGIVAFYRIDLLSKDFIHSPAFYLQQNDVVYVEPNDTYAAKSGINENKSVGIMISVASLLLTLAVIIFK